MRALAFYISCLTFFCAKAQDKTTAARRLYAFAGKQQDSATALVNLLATVNRESTAPLMCYKGAAEILSAKYTANPFKKYKAFLTGKKLIEAALAKDTADIEMRFIRFTVQTSLPRFLNYCNDIKSDKYYIIMHYRLLKNDVLKQTIANYFTACNCCTPGDVKHLMNERTGYINNSADETTGAIGKLQAHRLGLLHRAFSIFIFNSAGHLLLRQRQAGNYHSPLKWPNTCCCHPRLGEDILAAAQRRLAEEMSLHCQLHHIFKFEYFARVSETLAEHEIGYVFFGMSEGEPQLNPEEAAAYKYMPMNVLKEGLEKHPAIYTEWLAICFNRVYSLFNLFIL